MGACFRVLLLSMAVLSVASSASASPPFLWNQIFPNFDRGQGTDSAVDATGNIILAGSFTVMLNLGGDDLVAVGDDEHFLAKFDPDGVHLWSQRLGGPNVESVGDVAVDPSGNIIVVGSFSQTINFGGNDLTSAGFGDAYVVKFTAGGAHVWSQRYGGTGGDIANGIAIDSGANIIVTGAFDDTVDFGGGDIVGDRDVFLAKYGSDGSHLWSHGFVGGPFGFDGGFGVAIDGLDRIAVTGGFTGTVNLGGSDIVGTNATNPFLAKFRANGSHIWSQGFATTTSNGFGTAGLNVAIDGLGSIVMTGVADGVTDFGGGDVGDLERSSGFVAKYGGGGAYLWSRGFTPDGYFGDAETRGVAVDADGNVVIIGFFANTMDVGGSILTATPVGIPDIFLAGYSPNGSYLWSRQVGSTDSDFGRDVAIDSFDNLVATGSVEGGASTNVDFGGGPTPTGVGENIFLVKYGPSTVPVLIQRLEAVVRGDIVEVSWDFEADEKLDRFALYRQDDARPAAMIASGDANITRSYQDRSVTAGAMYYYTLVIRTADGDEFRSPVATVTIARLGVSLSQNYPNPFNPSTTIQYTVATTTVVSIEIFDASGALVRRIEEGERAAGVYSTVWDGHDDAGRSVASGTYFYRLAGIKGTDTRKMILLK